jgi:hypothetical protein
MSDGSQLLSPPLSMLIKEKASVELTGGI